MQEKNILVNGKKVHYATTGKGPEIVLVHGWTNNWMGWVPLMKQLKRNYSLYAVDLIGYGNSDRLSEYTVELQADYIAGFIRELNLKVATVCGLSMATFIVSDFALRFPKLTKTVVLIGAVVPVGRKRKIVRKLVQKSLEIINCSDLSEAAVKKIVEQKITGYITAKYLNMYKFNRLLIDAYGLLGRKQMSKEAFVQMGISISKYDLINSILSLKLPAQLIYGSSDKYTNIKQAQEVFKDKKGLSFVEIGQAGHITSLEKPKKVAEAIESFLKKIRI